MAYDSGLTKDELVRIAELGGMRWEWVEVDSDDAGAGGDGFIDVRDTEQGDAGERDGDEDAALLHALAEAAFDDDPDAFASFFDEHADAVRDAVAHGRRGSDVAELVVLAYRMEVSRGSCLAMNDLGSLYYRGEFVEQSYEAARELYEMAASRGVAQAMVNLGYIYEYGRTGAPDGVRALSCYASAAALSGSSEAICKMGDPYARGLGVERDMPRAHALWERSLDVAEDIVERSHPALRIARLLADPQSSSWGIESSPLRALALFQQAELGLRIDIADGQTYYQHSLEEALEGQARARALLADRR